ncbi:MAG: transglutaminaseTgpA domain-containing protein, partial [Desulfotignum sp.]|nr:transglutaminaseTgpA domain-containing protein [Desulfotignum sp.]
MKDQSVHVIPIICALVVAIAPHTPGLPLWIIAWCFSMWLYMLVQLRTGWPVPGPVLRHVMAFAGIAGLLATFRVQIGADAFVGLLAVMAAIKPFEMATHRHRMITVLLTYFIIITSLFRSESLW